jgi:hypothetical protein
MTSTRWPFRFGPAALALGSVPAVSSSGNSTTNSAPLPATSLCTRTSEVVNVNETVGFMN